jgi:serine/threonine-protein kinase
VILLALLLLAGGAYYGYQSYQKSLEREVPSFASMTVDEATQLAAGEDGESLNITVSGEEYNNDVEKGKIISQSVDAGTILKKGDSISVVISKGGLSTVPAVTGKKDDEAKQLVESSGLVYQVSDSVYSDDVKKGDVISQDTAEGSTLEEGSTVSVVVSKGIEQVEVPDVTGKELDKAKSKLKKSKIDYDKENSELVYSDSVDSGYVISQSLDPGKKVDKHTKITLKISKGPEPAPVVKKSSGSSGKKHSSRKRSSRKKKRSSGRKGWKHIN